MHKFYLLKVEGKKEVEMIVVKKESLKDCDIKHPPVKNQIINFTHGRGRNARKQGVVISSSDDKKELILLKTGANKKKTELTNSDEDSSDLGNHTVEMADVDKKKSSRTKQSKDKNTKTEQANKKKPERRVMKNTDKEFSDSDIDMIDVDDIDKKKSCGTKKSKAKSTKTGKEENIKSVEPTKKNNDELKDENERLKKKLKEQEDVIKKLKSRRQGAEGRHSDSESLDEARGIFHEEVEDIYKYKTASDDIVPLVKGGKLLIDNTDKERIENSSEPITGLVWKTMRSVYVKGSPALNNFTARGVQRNKDNDDQKKELPGTLEIIKFCWNVENSRDDKKHEKRSEITRCINQCLRYLSKKK